MATPAARKRAAHSTPPHSRTRGLADPVPDSSYARIDQGVDFVSREPVRALAAGTIVSHDHGMAGGTGDIIRQRFDKPVDVRGRTYYGAYYSEQKPLVSVGVHVTAGQPVMAPGSNEIGFLEGKDLAMPPLIGGLGAGTKPTKAGQDFSYIVHSLGGPSPDTPGGGAAGVPTPKGQAVDHGKAAAAPSGEISAISGPGTALVDRWHGPGGSFLDDILQGVPVLGPIVTGVSGVTDFLKLAVWIIDPFNWLRLFEAITGAILMLLGFLGLGVLLAAKSDVVQEAAGVAQLAPGPVGVAGRAATLASQAATRGSTGRQTRRRVIHERLPERTLERAATQQGEREEQRSQRMKTLAQARSSGRRRAQAARTRKSADRFGEVPF